MMRMGSSVVFFISKCLFLLFISVLVSTASATLVTGSAGTTYITGNDAARSTGSYRIQIDYWVYDGTSTSDPLGITSGNIQLAFKLTHLGSAGETPTLNIGRFTVFAPAGTPLNTYFYASQNSVGTGQAPSGTNLDPPPSDSTPRAKFMFQTGLQVANFLPNAVSKQLVVTTAASNFTKPVSILLEIDSTNAATDVAGDVYVNIVPEPCTMAIFSGAFALLYLKRRGGK